MTESTTSQGFRWDITVFIGFIQCRLSFPQGAAESIGIGWRFQSESSGGLRRNRQRAKSKRISSYLSEKKDESGSCVLLDSERGYPDSI